MTGLSPCCQRPLEGGPVIQCTGCGHDVHGSTINREYRGPVDCTHLHGAFGPGCPYCWTPRGTA